MNGTAITLSRRNYYHLSVADGSSSRKVLPCVIEIAEQELAVVNRNASAHLEEARALIARNVDAMRRHDDPNAAPGLRKRKLETQVLTGKHVTLSYSWRNSASKLHVLLPCHALAEGGKSRATFRAMDVLPQLLVLRLSLEKSTMKAFFPGDAAASDAAGPDA